MNISFAHRDVKHTLAIDGALRQGKAWHSLVAVWVREEPSPGRVDHCLKD